MYAAVFFSDVLLCLNQPEHRGPPHRISLQIRQGKERRSCNYTRSQTFALLRAKRGNWKKQDMGGWPGSRVCLRECLERHGENTIWLARSLSDLTGIAWRIRKR